MKYKAVIFDMDGLLIDSEPHWQEAGRETLAQYGEYLTEEQYHTSTGLRTEEWIEYWFNHFGIDKASAPKAIETIISKAIQKIDEYGNAFEGVDSLLTLFKSYNFRIGLATSSPLSLVEVVVKKMRLERSFDVITSAEKLPFGKPHPQVYLDCVAALGVSPLECIAFEDSFNGLIAAKAARLRCIIVPAISAFNEHKWNAADLKIKSLTEFNEAALLQFCK